MPITVVVADDHAHFRETLCRMLTSVYEPFEIVGEAKNGLEVIDLVNEKHPDLLLLDISMPELDGISALQQLKANPQNQKLKILILSVHDSIHYVKKALEAGADGYCTKDCGYKHILEAIEHILGGKKYISLSVE
jgi:DNA-binding NarL/FixJ family response regulator